MSKARELLKEMKDVNEGKVSGGSVKHILTKDGSSLNFSELGNLHYTRNSGYSFSSGSINNHSVSKQLTGIQKEMFKNPSLDFPVLERSFKAEVSSINLAMGADFEKLEDKFNSDLDKLASKYVKQMQSALDSLSEKIANYKSGSE